MTLLEFLELIPDDHVVTFRKNGFEINAEIRAFDPKTKKWVHTMIGWRRDVVDDLIEVPRKVRTCLRQIKEFRDRDGEKC